MKRFFFCFILVIICCWVPAGPVSAEDKTFVFYTGEQSPIKEIIETRLVELFHRIGEKSKLVNTGSAQRALLMANQYGDGDAYRIGNIKEIAPELTNNLLKVPEPIIDIVFYVYTKGENFQINDWKSLENYHNGFRVGAKILEKNIPGKTTILPDAARLFKMLDQGRIDTVTEQNLMADYIIRDLKLNNITKLSPPLVKLAGYCFIHKRNKHLIPALVKALSEMKADGSFKSIQDAVIKGK